MIILAGSIQYLDEDNPIEIFEDDTGDRIGYFYEDGTEVPDDVLRKWAIMLNSPWSVCDDTFTIGYNGSRYAKDPHPADGYEYKCKRKIEGYDESGGTCIGYGSTPKEALEDCISLFDYLQEMYNKTKLAV